ncbi:MAG TPA: hypothetical protein VFD01_08515 [Candidatus Dormibacteraeota bacterium]|jgi:hypothetical protein|nr:hypothetical protein [Candidatus Dormibacteraeota bacterium]
MADPAAPDRGSLYRPEALAHHRARPDGPDRPPSIAGRGSLAAFWALLAAIGMAVAASMLIQVGEYVSGPARLQGNGSTLLAVLPESAGPQLRRGGPVEVRLEAGPRLEARGSQLQVQPVDEATAARLLGPAAATDLPSSTGLLLVRARLPMPVAGPEKGRASVRVGGRPLLPTLLSGIAPAAGSG